MHDYISKLFDVNIWDNIIDFQNLTDITYHRHKKMGVVRIAFNRPEIRNAFRPHTVDELIKVLHHANASPDVGVIILTGNGPSPKDNIWAFCSGGDQNARGKDGYKYSNESKLGRLHILEVQRLIRTMPKVVIAAISGWTSGGGHSLHVVCDLSIASIEHGKFKQCDAKVGSFDGGYGSSLLARQVGQKFAREIFFLGKEYSSQRMYEMGAINDIVTHEKLEIKALEYAKEILLKSPQAIRMLKFAFNLADDGMYGQQVFAGEATRLAYMTDEAHEGKNAFLEKRSPNWSNFPWYY